MSKPKRKRERIPQTDVLAWLQETHPSLHELAEIERKWVWIAVNLKGDEFKPIRESIKEYGFIFSKRGGHALPSGKLGMWAHACERPMGFKRLGGKPSSSPDKGGGRIDPAANNDNSELDAESAALANLWLDM